MFLYYIPPPNKWQPHKAVKDSLGTQDNKIQIFCEKCSWLEIYRYFGTCSVVSLVFFCPDHYGRRPKSRVLISEKIWGSMKYFSMSNILDIEKYICVNTALSGKGIKEFETSHHQFNLCDFSQMLCLLWEIKTQLTSSAVCLQTSCSGSQEAAVKYNEKEKETKIKLHFQTTWQSFDNDIHGWKVVITFVECWG